MIHLPPNLLDGFQVFDVHDPDELGPDSVVSRRFPSNNNAHRYRLIDARGLTRSASDAAAPLARLSMRHAGDLLVGLICERYATDIGIAEPGPDAFLVSTVVHGALTLQTPGAQSVAATGHWGLVLRGEPGTRLRSSDDNVRLNVWVKAPRVERTLAALLGRELSHRLEFQPAMDFRSGGGASLRRLVQLLVLELAQPDGMAANALAWSSFTDLWIHSLLRSLPHNHREAMASLRHAAPVPGHVKRAEDFMREHSGRPVHLSEIAAAAGCSLRTLHAAFRSFRDTTPLAAFQRIRLEAVRAWLEAGGPALRAAEVARAFGFTNAGRFKAAYLRRFGVPPSGMRRR